MGNINIRYFIGQIGWKIYKWGCWYRNKKMLKLLDKDTATNLGYYLTNRTNKFYN